MESRTPSLDITSTARMRLARYERLIELAIEQQSILVSGDHSNLADNLSEFDPLLLEIKQIEKRENSMWELLDRSSHSSHLTEYNSIMGKTAEKASQLRQLITTNTRLLSNEMNLINFSIDVLYKTSASGEVRGTASPAIVFDTRV